MVTFVARRLLGLIPLILGVLLLTFLIMQAIPGSVIDRMLPYATAKEQAVLRHKLGLDRSVAAQFGIYLGLLARGDLGQTLATHQDVGREILSRLPNTVRLSITAMILAAVLGIGSGIVSAAFRETALDHAVRFLSLLGLSTPIFWFAILGMLAFALHLRWLPASGDGGAAFSLFLLPRIDLAARTVDFSGWAHLILPAITLGVRPAAFTGRVMRSTLLEALGQDYVRTARAKGLSRGVVVLKHALANALVPVVTLIGMDLGSLLAGAVITEKIFSFRGVGIYALQGIEDREPSIVMATVLLGAVAFVLANLATDIVTAWVDPRVREAQGIA